MDIKNIVLVSYDSVRRDVAYGLQLPGIQRLLECGLRFDSCISSSPLTPVSHASIMTGLHPAKHGIRHLFQEQLAPECTTLAQRLTRAGFSTSAVVSCPGLNSWYGINKGFGSYDDEIPRLPDGSNALETVDVKLRGQALKRAPLATERSRSMLLEQDKRPFFHFLHFFDAHWPYEPPMVPSDVKIANPYEGEVAFLDHHFSRWLDWLEESGRRDETLVVLFADHGEDLNGWYPNDKGGEERNHPEEMGHGCLLYDQTISVPLIFSHPSFEPRDIAQQVRLVDIMPTCLAAVGVEPESDLDGVDLGLSSVQATLASGIGYAETFYPSEQTEATGGEFAWARDKKMVRIDNRYKVIFHCDSDIVEVYDLVNDPNELKNLA